ncbi:hypothetical protein AAMO2058_001680400 [Amorphochlora amoebiformis]
MFGAAFALFDLKSARAMEYEDPEEYSRNILKSLNPSKSREMTPSTPGTPSGLEEEISMDNPSPSLRSESEAGGGPRERMLRDYWSLSSDTNTSSFETDLDMSESAPPFLVQIHDLDEYFLSKQDQIQLVERHRQKSTFHTGLWSGSGNQGYWPGMMKGVRNLLDSAYPFVKLAESRAPPTPPLCRIHTFLLPLPAKEVRKASDLQIDQITSSGIVSWVHFPFNLNPKRIADNLRERMNAFQIKRVGIIRFHWLDYLDTRHISTIRMLANLRITSHISLVDFNSQNVKKVIDALGTSSKVKSVTVSYSILDQRPLAKLTPYCKKHGLKIHAYGSLAGGLLSDFFLNKDSLGEHFSDPYSCKLGSYRDLLESWGSWESFQYLLQTLRTIANKHQVSISMVAMRWVLQQTQVAGLIDDSDLVDSPMFRIERGVPGLDPIIPEVKKKKKDYNEMIEEVYNNTMEK